MSFDLSTHTAVSQREEEGTLVHVKNAAGEPQFFEDGKPVTIRVAGTYSATYRRAVGAQRERMLKGRRGTLSSEQLERQQLELLAACVLSWEGIENGGQPFPCTKENAIALLEHCPWIREDVELAMSDHQSFFSGSSPA